MKIIQINLHGDFSLAIDEAINVLESGGTIIYPTDTLYGLGANALNIPAVKRIFSIKEQRSSKPLPTIVRDLMWAKELAHINLRQEEILKKVWPGKVTAILEKKDIIPEEVTGGNSTVGLRVPDLRFTDELLKKYGYPLTATSANISGQEPSQKIDDIIEVFSNRGYKPDLVINAGTLPQSNPSVIVDITTDKPKVLRAGPSRPDQLLKILEI